MMKVVAIAASALVLTAGMAAASPGGKFGYGHGSHVGKYSYSGKLTVFERMRIARSKMRLARLERRIKADGRVTRRERAQLIAAKKRHQALVRHALRY
jgi:hypothetical protein